MKNGVFQKLIFLGIVLLGLFAVSNAVSDRHEARAQAAETGVEQTTETGVEQATEVGVEQKKAVRRPQRRRPGRVDRRRPGQNAKQSTTQSDKQSTKQSSKQSAGKTPTGVSKTEETGKAASPKAVSGSEETRPKGPAPGKRTLAGETGQIVFNFDEADLREVIRTVAEILDISYMIEPGVGGKVTIHTAGKLRKEELFPVFLQILEVNGVAAIKEGELYRIIKRQDAPRLPVGLRFSPEDKRIPPGQRIIIQIVPLTYISASEMNKLLDPFLSKDGVVVAHEASNTLLVVDKVDVILKALQLVKVFDVDLFERVNHRFYTLEYLDAEEAGKIVAEVFASFGTGQQVEVKFIAISRLNTLIVISQRPQVFRRVEQLIRQLDSPSEDAEPRIFVYSVKNGEAAQLGELLNNIFAKKDAKGTGSKKGATEIKPPRNPFSKEYQQKLKEQKTREKTTKAKQARTQQTGGAGGETSPGTLKGEIRITVDEVRNALVIEATSRDYRIVERILQRLDVLPRQVLIEVMIAEISLEAKNELGVEWSYSDSEFPGSGLISAAAGSTGLAYAVGIGNRVKMQMTALANDNRVNILSSPMVLASDNKEARIDVSTEVPVASAQISYASSGATPLTETNIQYRDTGILLTVTPHINERGLVSMEISQEVSEQSEPVLVGGTLYPSFF
ncbi:MAG: hypothetical protein JRJ60_15320, partial [Deltaproteobacteria bacterium]|nr:hypothetical protein [Deltaproteobacteria bacterium]